jgi:hypothetical protein
MVWHFVNVLANLQVWGKEQYIGVAQRRESDPLMNFTLVPTTLILAIWLLVAVFHCVLFRNKKQRARINIFALCFDFLFCKNLQF